MRCRSALVTAKSHDVEAGPVKASMHMVVSRGRAKVTSSWCVVKWWRTVRVQMLRYSKKCIRTVRAEFSAEQDTIAKHKGCAVGPADLELMPSMIDLNGGSRRWWSPMLSKSNRATTQESS